MNFVGRRGELEALRSLCMDKTPKICVVYGRRRVGKTSLIKHAFKNHHLFTFEGLENQSKHKQIENFLFQLKEQTGVGTTIKTPVRDWREALLTLVPIVKKKPSVVLLDEFQWMANYRHELVSDLKMIWDRYLIDHKNLLLILCGSIASFMVRQVLKSKALYGRTDISIHLKPFRLHDTSQFFPQRSSEEVILAQILVGGIPKYLELLRNQQSILLGIRNLAFSEQGYFWNEYDRIFTSHFGQRSKYETVVGALAKRGEGITRLALANIIKSSGGGELTRVLYNLETAGFIRSYTPYDKPARSKLLLYILSDPYLRFYFSFIRPVSAHGIEKHQDFMNHIVPSPRFRNWLARGFELLCMEHSSVIANILGFGGIEYVAGPYFRSWRSGNTPGVQIDLLFDRADKIITICEMKFQDKSIGLEVARDVQTKIEKIPILKERTLQKVLITKSEPSKELMRTGYFSSIIRAQEFINHDS